MIEKILFPVDFSPSCAAMANYVRRAADLLGARVTLVHVCDLASHNAFELYVRSPGEVAAEHASVARDKLDSFLAFEFPPDQYPRILRSGEAAAEIVDVARTGGFDLIVMPTHAGRFRRMLLGSTTAKVLNDSECPILATEHAESIAPRALSHRVWVCAIGLSADSERVLRLASGAAANVHSKLSIIHVIHGATPAGGNVRRQLDELQKTVGCEAAVLIAKSPVKDALLDAAGSSDADVLIVGRTPRPGALGGLGILHIPSFGTRLVRC